jgi:hypothetical protein
MRELVIIGIGELGKLLGAGALRVGVRVTPVTRTMHIETVLKEIAPRTPILVSVGERALPELLATLPAAHRESVVLLQNELFPSIYRAAQLRPSVLVPWVMQKPGMPTLVARPSPIYGGQADLFAEIFSALSIAHLRIANEGALAQALVDKYTFILTINALGLSTDRTLGMWLQEDPAQVWDICSEASRLGEALVEAPIDAAQAQHATQEAMVALSHVPARGRSARERVDRALGHARRLKLSLSAIARIADTH